MRDFPIFPTEYGVSSLSLKEIPYRKQAYIQIREVQPGRLAEHLAECAHFCRMAGAERVFAAGHPDLRRYPPYATIYKMRATAWVNPDKLAHLFPVTRATAGRWREIYNTRMAGVDNAATLEARDEDWLIDKAYFVHRNGHLLGIGCLEDGKLLAMAATEPGAGETVMHTLMSLVEGMPMTLEVASTNLAAIRLYARLGFLKIAERNTWYEIPEKDADVYGENT